MANAMLRDAVGMVRHPDQVALHAILATMDRDELELMVLHTVFLAHGLAGRDAEVTGAWLDHVLDSAEDRGP